MSGNILTIDPVQLPQPKLHHYLLSAIAPRPICFASTIDQHGQVNLSPFSFFNVFSSNPPILIFSPARSGRDGSAKDTHENVLQVKEVVINIVNYSIVEQMSLASTAYSSEINEFIKAGLTQVASEKVGPPRVGEAPVAFECVVDQVIPLGEAPGAGNLVIARVVLMHLHKAYLDEQDQLDTQKLDLVARMGGSWYCRAIDEALFEIPKPVRGQGIGVDQLPKSIRESTILTGNNLGRLGNLNRLPDEEELQRARDHEDVQNLLMIYPNASLERHNALHVLAKAYLEANEPQDALAILMLSIGH